MKSRTSYIAFLDLLGTKDLSEDDSDSYHESVEIFEEVLNREVKDMCNAYAFSDCAYLECDSKDSLIKIIDSIRDAMMRDKRFFTAAIAQGTLDTVCHIRDKGERGFNCFSFHSKDISRVYIRQSSLKGIGICVDPDMLKAGDRKKCDEFCRILLPDGCSIFKNFFIADIKKPYECTFFYDVSFDATYDQIAEERQDDIRNSYFDFILNAYYHTNLKSPRYGRYYISPIINLLSSIPLNDEKVITLSEIQVTTDNKNFEAEQPVRDITISSKIIAKLFNGGRVRYLCNYAPGFCNVFLFLLSKIYRDRNGCDNITLGFLKRIMDLNVINNILADFSKLPKQLFSRETLSCLLDDLSLLSN